MAKKLSKTKKKKSSKNLPADAIKWFSRFLRNSNENTGKAISLRKGTAENDCKKILADLTDDWKISVNGFQWDSPQPPEQRFKLTVWIEPKRKTVTSTDPPIPAPKQPPPTM